MEAGAATNGGSAISDDEAATNGGSATSDEETDRRPSLNSLALMRKATTPTNISSVDVKDWHLVVYDGVLLKDNTQKFWVDAKLHKNCFLVLPRACEIAGDDEESCWSWITKEEKCFRSTVDIQVPKLEKLPWLLIQGKFKTIALSPNTMYEVAFVVQLTKTGSTWFCPVYVELDLPDGTKKESDEFLQWMPVYKWIELRAGEFMMCPENVGTISFALRGTVDPEKTGLILKGVLIHPKDEAKQSPV
ncbi:hypothetical protein ACJRO7_005551 [Eucalyptus globulus]|uniref:Uncharacterized protein n=1 Tax=Eucalyptus globulus TaxID=34317 RepID=A0ABD3J2Z6_EUCGL